MSAEAVLEDAAKGAMGGMALGPIGAAGGAVLGALTDVLPGLATAFFGKNGGAVANAALAAAASVTGTANPSAAQIAGLPPEQQAALRLQLAQIAATAAQSERQAALAEIQTHLADVASARAQTVALANAHSAIAWGAPIVSFIISVGFFVTIYFVMTRPFPPGVDNNTLHDLFGTMSAAFMLVAGYWLGSSAGSALKTEHLANSVPASFAAAQGNMVNFAAAQAKGAKP